MKKIGIVGAPGAGKTTLSAGLFYHLKIAGFDVELTPELIKYKVYRGVNFSSPGFDILNTLEQMGLEETIEQAPTNGHNLDFLICEAPLCNGYFYASFYGKQDECSVLKTIAQSKIRGYDLLILMERPESQVYKQFGRKENELTAARLQSHIITELRSLNPDANIIRARQDQPIQATLESILGLLEV
jgi:predicted ATPase